MIPRMASPALTIRPIGLADRPFLQAEMQRHWGTANIWSIGRPYPADELPGFIAELESRPVGQITAALEPRRCEIITLSATIEDRGIGTALLAAAVTECRTRGYRSVTLTTTNDNLRAIAFYQKRGWRLVAVHAGMMDRYRESNANIPTIGLNDIPLRDELEFAFEL